ncbi:MAG: Clp protease N-terminal domain-containing protein, partial [Eubacteriales bacterium]|nr:Clp protease N-terminal domain-containing protein [Eubacteriales bacterium]
MNFEKFTQNAQSAVIDCQNIGVQEGHQQLDGEHLHLALMQQHDGLIPKLISYSNISTAEVISELQTELERLPKVQGGNDNIYTTRRLNQILINAEKISADLKDEYISVE